MLLMIDNQHYRPLRSGKIQVIIKKLIKTTYLCFVLFADVRLRP
jgi:hypothetical protein